MRRKIVLNTLPDIRYFLTKFPKQKIPSASHLPRHDSLNSLLIPPKDVDALMQDDLVRKEHDRGKKMRKGSSDVGLYG